MMILFMLRMQFGLLNLPGDEVGDNKEGRRVQKIYIGVVIIMLNVLLANQIFTSKLAKVFIGFFNMICSYACVIGNTFYMELLSKSDVILIVAIASSLSISVIVFTHINNKNLVDIIGQRLQIAELNSYK